VTRVRVGCSRTGVLAVAVATGCLVAGACSTDSPHRRSADILAEVLAEASERNATPVPVTSSLGGLPASFAGTVPCTDCPGIRMHLNLFNNRTFVIRTAYLGPRARAVDDMGTWALGADRRTLTLRGSRQALRRFVIRDDRTIRQLDVEGREIVDGQSHDLVRGAFEPLEPSLSLQGLFVYQADAGMFTECLTRQRWPVAAEAANAELERAYLNERTLAGAEVLVAVEGRLTMRPSMDGGEPRETLVVDRVAGAWGNRGCGARAAAASLDRTAWTLTHLGTSPVDTTGLPLAPYLELRPGRAEFAGSDGCNRLVGTYERDGDRIRFQVGAVTRIGCPEGSRVSRAFSDALAATFAWQIAGDDLELLDDRGRTRLRLTARR
jgi:copper homeostasis protein (lipoprotein)